ncbi:MAG: ergothioneine biosynthesis protein EgtB [Acidobacteriaceae bacterium]
MSILEVSPLEVRSGSLAERFRSVRAMTDTLAQPLTAEDMMVQSCPEASPVKWHLAHTTWFFETFVLQKYLPAYRPFHPDFLWLFNSYYKSLGDHPDKQLRASFSRPSLDQIRAYRRQVEDGIAQLLENGASEEMAACIELGMHHEQQHQELIATDIKHAFWSNPLLPSYAEPRPAYASDAAPLRWLEYSGGLVEVGNRGEGFGFDNEFSRHKVFLEPFRIASRPVTCADFLEFIQANGYNRPELWLSDGWETVQKMDWQAPLYWRRNPSDKWDVFTLRGLSPLDDLLSTPVCHVSYYEADAYARWAGSRLPTEFEWEHAAGSVPVSGNLLENGTLHPAQAQMEADAENSPRPKQMFGDVWEWTRSPYVAYPGYRPAPGALGEYNGKFMCNQFVLRGGSVATPATHVRASYRNFFAPATRWQFSGIRLAADAAYLTDGGTD